GLVSRLGGSKHHGYQITPRTWTSASTAQSQPPRHRRHRDIHENRNLCMPSSRCLRCMGTIVERLMDVITQAAATKEQADGLGNIADNSSYSFLSHHSSLPRVRACGTPISDVVLEFRGDKV